MQYLINISRFLLIIIFAYSLIGKLRAFTAFEGSIHNFQLLPRSFHRPVAIFIISLEALVVTFSLLGGNFLFLSLCIAILLLLLFIYALSTVLKRKISTTCNCFGINEQRVSVYDIWRNLGIILILILGLFTLSFGVYNNTNILELIISLIFAIILSVLLLNLRDFMEFIA